MASPASPDFERAYQAHFGTVEIPTPVLIERSVTAGEWTFMSIPLEVPYHASVLAVDIADKLGGATKAWIKKIRENHLSLIIACAEISDPDQYKKDRFVRFEPGTIQGLLVKIYWPRGRRQPAYNAELSVLPKVSQPEA